MKDRLEFFCLLFLVAVGFVGGVAGIVLFFTAIGATFGVAVGALIGAAIWVLRALTGWP